MSAALDHPGVTLRADHLIGLRDIALLRPDPPALSALPGGLVSRKRGQGQEIADVREYVSGDDIRHLDRGSTARTGVLHVRAFQEDRDRVTLLVADFRPPMLWGSRRAFRSVAAAEALALIGWRVIHEGGRVGLITLGAAQPVAVPARGRVRGMLAVIGGLVRAHEMALSRMKTGDSPGPPLDTGIARAARVAAKGAEIVIASGLDDPGADLAAELGQMARRTSPRLIRIADAADALPPGLYPVRLPNGTRRRVRVAGSSAPSAAEATAEYLADIPALTLDAGTDPGDMAWRISAEYGPLEAQP